MIIPSMICFLGTSIWHDTILLNKLSALNFFVVPAAVVGATLLWCKELDRAY